MAREIIVELRPDIEKALLRFEELGRIAECDQVVVCSFDFQKEYDHVAFVLACFFAGKAGAK